jgi:ZIP family zinc transporter
VGTQEWVVVLLLASLSIATTAAGVVLAVKVGNRPRAVTAGIGFSAGTMVAVSVVELLPEACAQAGTWSVTVWAVTGASIIALLHLMIPHTHLGAAESPQAAQRLRSVYLIMFGLILHDLPEGFALANSYVSAPRLGILVAIAVAAHNLPEEFAMAMPAVALRRRRLLLRAAVLSALAEPVGALIGLAGVSAYPGLNAAFLAIAAGAMMFVSVNELFPMARDMGHRSWFSIGALGSVCMVVVLQQLLST